ncbi:MAG: hypothetical protein AB1806_11360, partial [Acidobacteriota bacterium]
SAGTIVALGATEVVFLDVGELGPLDVQMTKPDELVQTQSGLTATSAIGTLNEQSYQAFETFLLRTVRGGSPFISTRTATQIAVQLVSGLFSPIYAHVDPMHIGEAGRALRIAERYGQILGETSQNLKPGALETLTSGYPSHGFVIDQKQADGLFRRVRSANEKEVVLADRLGRVALDPRPFTEDPVCLFLNEPDDASMASTDPVHDPSRDDDHDQPQNGSTGDPGPTERQVAGAAATREPGEGGSTGQEYNADGQEPAGDS